jgi:very-short-patch-repair endonuclease
VHGEWNLSAVQRGGQAEGAEVALWHTHPELWDKLKPLARQMRHEPTDAEDRLWQALRRKSLDGWKFRRQHTIERFIVDFYCPKAHLVIEVDGEIHQYTVAEDAARTELLETLGMRVLRFSNSDVLNGFEGVLKSIRENLAAARHSVSVE